MTIPTPTLHTDRLILREITDADIPAYERHFIDFEVIQHLSLAAPWPYPENGVSDFLQKVIYPTQGESRWDWAICLKENPAEMIGGVSLWRDGQPEHRGFWLGRQFWGNGYMTEAVTPVMDFAFNEAGFERLIFSNADGNEGSHRIKEKTGARFLRYEPSDNFHIPKYTRSVIWELTKEDWEAHKVQEATKKADSG